MQKLVLNFFVLQKVKASLAFVRSVVRFAVGLVMDTGAELISETVLIDEPKLNSAAPAITSEIKIPISSFIYIKI